jgi:hypothetical protein
VDNNSKLSLDKASFHSFKVFIQFTSKDLECTGAITSFRRLQYCNISNVAGLSHRVLFFFFPMARQPLGGLGLLISRGFAITHFRHTTLGRTPLDEGPARHRDLYLKTHNTHKRQTSMPRWDLNPRSQQASGRRLTP